LLASIYHSSSNKDGFPGQGRGSRTHMLLKNIK
jgi:hypothetical protein